MKRTTFILRLESGKLIQLSVCCAVMQGNMRPSDRDVYGHSGTYWHRYSDNLTAQSWIGDTINVLRNIPNHTQPAKETATVVAKQVIEYDGTTFPVYKLQSTIQSSKNFAELYQALADQRKQEEWAQQRARITASSQRYGGGRYGRR